MEVMPATADPPARDEWSELRAALQRTAKDYGLDGVTVAGPVRLPEGMVRFLVQGKPRRRNR